MSFNKNLVVAGFTLALLVASSYGDFPGAMASSYGGMAGNYCYERTETECTSDETCRTICLEKGDSYVGGYCSKVASSSCICIKKCAAQFPHGAAGLGPASA
ncbi:hypothetical protein SETIT_8G151000v2 [Setaria italica]|uniref:Knottin scorpion toxin-like domain-containing protein n=2 Tax=Setaria TaxID=4554 RepID=K3ZKH3_SETIT|nr:hypothetical protein SETIT_8G151000v2 [Setaria italica]TKW01182.1 hypothetical protein SEVIR_8G162700v2 [Setaria viridis]